MVDPRIVEHRGRIVKTTGDGLLVEFASVVEAVRCAVDVQREMAERNTGVPAETRIEFRVGINLGDIIIDGDGIFGDGVNVAARLEPLAEPGRDLRQPGGARSGARQARLRVRGYGRAASQGHRPAGAGPNRIESPYPNPRPACGPQAGEVSRVSGRVGATALALPDKPSIAVLPFQNMSGDPEQEYFADGMVAEIITALSRIRRLFVIARNSTFTYKAKPTDVLPDRACSLR